MKRYLGIDVGGTSVKHSLYDEGGRELSPAQSTPSVRDDSDRMINILSDIITSYGAIDGVGLSMCGGINKDTDVIIEGGAISSLNGVDLLSILRGRHPLPIQMENDANSAALAEYWLGNGKDVDCFVLLTIGTGVGGSIVINGKLHRGRHNYAGEFGHAFLHNDPLQTFGIASTGSLIDRANEAGLNIQSGKEFFAQLDNADVKAFYDQWIDDLALGIFNIAACLDPGKVLLGGGIMGHSFVFGDINKRLEELVELSGYKFAVVAEPCKFGNDAGKIGAIYKLIKGRDNV